MKKIFDIYYSKVILLVLLVIFSIPFLKDTMDIVINIFVIWIFIVLLVNIYNGRIFTGRRKIFAILFLGLYGITVILNGFNVPNIVNGFYMTIQLLLLSINEENRDMERDLRNIFRIVAVIGFIFAAISLILYVINYREVFITKEITKTLIIGVHNNSLYGLVGNSNYQAFMCYMSMISSLYLYEKDEMKKMNIVNMIIQFITIALTNSRGIFIILCLFAFLYNIFRKKDGIKFIKKFGIAIISIVLIFVFTWSSRFIFGNVRIFVVNYIITEDWKTKEEKEKELEFIRRQTEENESTSIRIDMYKASFEASKEKPIFGNGTYKVEDVIKKYLPEDHAYRKGDLASNTHNLILKMIIYAGYPATIILLCYFALIYWNSLKDMLNGFSTRATIIFSFLITIIPLNMIESDAFVRKNFETIFIWIIIGYIFYEDNDNVLKLIFRKQK